MALNNSLEKPIFGVSKSIVSLGSFEADGSYPYVYNNYTSGIVLQDLDNDFVATDNNIIQNTKVIEILGRQYTFPLIKNQVCYELIPDIVKKSNLKTSYIVTFPVYKTISVGYDSNGMLLYGFRYDQDPDKTYKFKTVGVRIVNDIDENGLYGFRIKLQALQYDRDDDGNTTITDIKTVYDKFYNFYYSLDKIVLLISTQVTNDGDDDYLSIELNSVNRDLNGDRLISTNGSLKLSDINLTKDNVTQCVTMPELNQSIEYTLCNIKVYGDYMPVEQLEQQSYISTYKS